VCFPAKFNWWSRNGNWQRAELTKERVLPGKYQNKTWEGVERQGNEDYFHD